MTQNTEQKNRDFLQVKVGTVIGFDDPASYYFTDKYEVKELSEVGTIEGKMLGWALTSTNDVGRWVGRGQWDSSGGYIISQPAEGLSYDPDAYMAREHLSPGASSTKQNVRTRDEQVADLTNLFGEEGTFTFVDDRDAATKHILEAEVRGAEEIGRAHV